jgi:transcriptional regulator with GAF, ATPase, and Fis domain
MALVAFPTSRPGSEEDLHPFERLAVRLSSSFSVLQADDVDTSVAWALEEIGAAFDVDECTLIAYGQGGSVGVVQSWAAPPHPGLNGKDLSQLPFLVARVARNAVTVITPTTEVPHAAEKDVAYNACSGVVARLGVPVVVGSRVMYGLIVGSRQRHADWSGAVLERFRLAGEILGSSLARVQHVAVAHGRLPASDPAAPDADGEAIAASSPGADNRVVATSVPMRVALQRVAQVAPLDATVLLLGETGTGKELLARAVHEGSRRRRQRLICVNCAALPATLIESELFGHERGAFTGATTMRQGRFELADGGTIFLDEIGDLALELQAKLLRVLQEGEFERVGSSKTRKVDVRVIAATHVDLEAAVAEGRFRPDLFYRLSVFPITLPPLRERPEDIPDLVWLFIRRHERHLGRQIARVPVDVMKHLQSFDWPGNVRELENVIARAMIHGADDTLQLDESPRAQPRGQPLAVPATESGETLDAVQRRHIERVLRECGGRINGAGNAANRLGLHPNTLRFRIKKLGVAKPGPGVPAPPSTSARPG